MQSWFYFPGQRTMHLYFTKLLFIQICERESKSEIVRINADQTYNPFPQGHVTEITTK